MGKFHISTQILQGNTLFSGQIYTAGIFYTTVGRDSHDKFQVWPDDMADNTLYDMPYEMPDDMPKICLMICPKYA